MDIQALTTEIGFDILKNHMYEQVKHFVLLGLKHSDDSALDALISNQNALYEDIKPYVFHEAAIDRARYDDRGVLTFELPLPYEPDFDCYIYGIGLLGTGKVGELVLVSIAPTPKIMKFSGVGGTFTYKVNITGESGALIFDSTNAVTPDQMKCYVDEMLARLSTGFTYGTIGDITYAADKDPRKNQLYCDGSIFIPMLYPQFYEYWQSKGFEKYCGRDALTGWPRLPDLRGVVLRAVDDGAGRCGAAEALGYQYDGIRNIKGSIKSTDNEGVIFEEIANLKYSGALYPEGSMMSAGANVNTHGATQSLIFDASRTVPVTPDNRMKSRAVYPYITVDTRL